MIRFFRWPAKVLCFLAIGLFVCPGSNAQCKLPPELDAQLRAHPTEATAIEAGNWFGSHHQFDCAAEIFRAALKTDPKSAQLYYLEGLALTGAGHPEKAVDAVQQSTLLDPKVIKPHLLLASLDEQAGRHDDADEQWRMALAIDPKSEPALEEFSSALLARKDYVSIVALLQHAPRTETLALRLAQAFGMLNYLDQASDVLNEAIKLSPKSLALANAESVVLIKQRLYEEAVKLLAFTVAEHPGDRDAQMQYLRILVLTQHNDRARPLGLKLLAQTPHDAEVLYLNGVVDRAVGDYPKSKAHLEEAVSLVPDFFNSRYHLGVTLAYLHEWPEAKEQLQKAIALGDGDAQVHFELAKVLSALGEKDQAQEELKKYTGIQKADEDILEAASHVAQGDKDLAAGNLHEAIADYRSACDQLPANAGYKYDLSIALHKAGDTEGERAQLEAAIQLDPKLAGAQKQLGYLLSRGGDAAAAVEHFKMAVEAAPAWPDAWVSLAAELAVEEHFADARKAVAMAIRLDPGNAQARELSNQLASDPNAQQAQP